MLFASSAALFESMSQKKKNSTQQRVDESRLVATVRSTIQETLPQNDSLTQKPCSAVPSPCNNAAIEDTLADASRQLYGEHVQLGTKTHGGLEITKLY